LAWDQPTRFGPTFIHLHFQLMDRDADTAQLQMGVNGVNASSGVEVDVVTADLSPHPIVSPNRSES
jgi:hypothetical protein